MATRSFKGELASSSCIKPKHVLESWGALMHETVPGDGRGFFEVDGVKNGEIFPVCFLGVTGPDRGRLGVDELGMLPSGSGKISNTGMTTKALE